VRRSEKGVSYAWEFDLDLMLNYVETNGSWMRALADGTLWPSNSRIRGLVVEGAAERRFQTTLTDNLAVLGFSHELGHRIL